MAIINFKVNQLDLEEVTQKKYYAPHLILDNTFKLYVSPLIRISLLKDSLLELVIPRSFLMTEKGFF